MVLQDKRLFFPKAITLTQFLISLLWIEPGVLVLSYIFKPFYFYFEKRFYYIALVILKIEVLLPQPNYMLGLWAYATLPNFPLFFCLSSFMLPEGWMIFCVLGTSITVAVAARRQERAGVELCDFLLCTCLPCALPK